MWVLLSDVTPKAVRLYGLLSALYGGPGLPEPAKSELAVLMRVGVDTVDGYLRQLIRVGALHKLPQVYDQGVPTPPRFCLRSDPPEEAVQIPEIKPDPDTEFVRSIVADRPRIFTPSARSQRESSTSTSTSTSTRTQYSLPKTKNTNAILRYPRFVEFWRQYPRSHARDRALRRWIQSGAEADQHLYGAVLAGLERSKERWRIEKRTGKYIPYAARWLSEQGWLDHMSVDSEPPPPTQTTIWHAISAEVAKRVDAGCYRDWFGGATQIAHEDGAITVEVVSAAWVSKHYTQIVQEAQESSGHEAVTITWVTQGDDQVGADAVGDKTSP